LEHHVAVVAHDPDADLDQLLAPPRDWPMLGGTNGSSWL
jgi:hypothetical protein